MDTKEIYKKMWNNLKYDMCRMADYDVEQNWLDEMYKLEQKHLKEK